MAQQYAYQGNTYEGRLRQSLLALGANDPDGYMRRTGDFWRHCAKLGIAPEVTAANIYAIERHHHEVGFPGTTLKEAPVAKEPSRSRRSRSRTSSEQTEVSFRDFDDAKRFARLLETKRDVRTFVGGDPNGGAIVTTNASFSLIEQTLKRRKFHDHVILRHSAAEECDPSAMGDVVVASVVSPTPPAPPTTSPTPPTAAIPWQKVSRDPKQHDEIAALVARVGPVKGPTEVFAIVGEELNKETQEVFLVLALDIHGNLMAPAYEVARGQRDRVTVGIDNVLDAASDARCAGFVVVHNHPSGKVKPSEADLQLTQTIRRSTPPGRKFIDHVIVAQDRAYSCMEGKAYRVKGSVK